MSAGDSLTDLIGRAIRNRLAEVSTAMPAKVTAYDYRTQKASVQPVINRRYADGQIEPFPVINNVPVIFPRSGGASMTFPVKPDDTVLLIFAQRSIDSWIANGGTVNQDDNRMHSLNDAIAIPGLIPFSAKSKAKNNSDVLLTYAGSDVEIKGDGTVNINSPKQINMSAPKVEVSAPDVVFKSDLVRMTGDLIVEKDIFDQDTLYGSFGHFREIYNMHTHNENDDAPAPTDATNHPWGETGA